MKRVRLELTIVAIAVAVILSSILSLVIWIVLRKRRRNQTSRISMIVDGMRAFTYEEMAQATNNFRDSEQVGEGGYGKVYRGILVGGTVVAIKHAQVGSLRGERAFLTEIQFLSRLHHVNLVSLIGYCDEKGEQMLVYEYMQNGTLRDNIFDRLRAPLSFPRRVCIALGSANGIRYLHAEANPPVFHRDIKSNNILLDLDFTAKVADFGISWLAPSRGIQGAVETHVSTMAMGTRGYVDPEYLLTNRLTDKSDVYSLGVVFLELLTGMQVISHGKLIVREVKVACQSGLTLSVIDGRMRSYSPSGCIKEFLALSLQCCEDNPDVRPTITEVVRRLENIWSVMPESDIARRAVSEAPRSDSGTVFGSCSSSAYVSAVEEEQQQ